jgi:hypothetical protein
MKEYRAPFVSFVGPAASSIRGSDVTSTDAGGDAMQANSPLLSNLEEE